MRPHEPRASVTTRVPSERSFGLTVGVVCAAIGAFRWWRGHGLSGAVLAVVGAALVGAALVAPGALRIPNRIWWRIAQVLGWINTRVLLTAFFFLLLTPVGYVMRLLGRNPLRPAWASTSWSAYSDRRRDPKHYEHMF